MTTSSPASFPLFLPNPSSGNYPASALQSFIHVPTHLRFFSLGPMFLSFRDFAQTFLTIRRQPDSSEKREARAAGQQIQRELEVAAEEGMVTTMAQERDVGKGGLEEGRMEMVETVESNVSGVAVVGEEGLVEALVEAHSAKRRNVDGAREHDGVEDGNGRPRIVAAEIAAQNNAVPSHLANTPIVMSPTVQVVPDDMHISTTMTAPLKGQNSTIPEDTRITGDERRGKAAETEHGNNESRRLVNPRKKKKRNKNVNGDLKVDDTLAVPTSTQLHDDFATTDSGMKKSVHKRFGSEEPDPPLGEMTHNSVEGDSTNGISGREDRVELEDNSDDDAPEVVTASVGHNQARNTTAEALKAADRQALAQKEKRRARDAQLKKQAAAAQTSRRVHPKRPPNHLHAQSSPDDDATTESNPTKPSSRRKFKRTDPIPDFLPDEILVAEPEISLPILPSIPATLDQKKRKFVDSEPKPPKDIKRGSVRVRVLEDNNFVLPPWASKPSKSLRESWLAGKRGRNDVFSRRRKIGGGFVRK